MISPALEFDLQSSIRTIPDYPKTGIMFRDITTLLRATHARSAARWTSWCIRWAGMKIDKIAGIEARGFILGGAVAHQVSAGLRADPQGGAAARHGGASPIRSIRHDEWRRIRMRSTRATRSFSSTT